MPLLSSWFLSSDWVVASWPQSSASKKMKSTPTLGASESGCWLRTRAISRATATALAPSEAPSIGAFFFTLSLSAKGRVSQWPKMAIRRAAVGWYWAMMLRARMLVPSKVIASKGCSITFRPKPLSLATSQSPVATWAFELGTRGPKATCLAV